MTTFTKKAGRDFVILNLTDIHMDDGQLKPGSVFLDILHYTLDALIERVRPDLITITGDLAWGGHHAGQRHIVDKIESYGIPWAPVFGNHDHDAGDDVLERFEEMLHAAPHCIYEAGDRAIGVGNYTIRIEDENGRPLEGMILMDSHQNVPYVNKNGETKSAWAKLWENQLEWYANEAKKFKDAGCPETAIFQHIPPYGYHQAWTAAFREDLNPQEMPVPHGATDCWNPGYETSTGVHYEGVGCYPEEDGVLDVVVATDSTKYIFCGHEHVNNWNINYRGIHLVYTLKIGSGAYWKYPMNGGTVIRVGENGISSVEHEYIALPQEILERI